MDMSDAERGVMQQHIAYWKGFMDQGKVIVFGPVFDPGGAYGMGVLQMDSEGEVNSFMAADPSVLSSLNSFEIFAMRAVTPTPQ